MVYDPQLYAYDLDDMVLIFIVGSYDVLALHQVKSKGLLCVPVEV